MSICVSNFSSISPPPPEPLPLSYSQQRLWFLDRLQGSSAEYNASQALRLTGDLNVPALVRSINTIVERHDSLRTRFLEIDGEPVQVIDSRQRIAVPLEDLRELNEKAREHRVREEIRRVGTQPFNLASGPLLRIKLLRLGNEEHVLLYTVHHIVWDGWSQGVFKRELSRLYCAFVEGRENPLAPLRTQFADFTLWQRQDIDGRLNKGRAYWRKQLEGIPEEIALPMDRPRPPVQTLASELYQIVIPAELLTAAKQLSRTNQATLYMTLLSVFGALLSRYSGQDDIVIGSPVANRPDARLEDMIGFFVNTLVMRLQLPRGLSFRQLLAEVKQTTLDAYQHQDVPFEWLVEDLEPQRSLAKTPLIQVLFAMQNVGRAPLQLDGLAVEKIARERFDAHFDFHVEARELSGAMELSWLYNANLFDRWRIEQMAGHYLRLLAAVTADPDQIVTRIDLLGTGERTRILQHWNDTRRPAPSQTLPELFQAQAARTPDALAVVHDGATLSYGELNRLSNGLAHHLIGLGVTPDTRVAICTERGSEMIVALLGVLKAGGAYVPLDPAYPHDRLRFMVEDSKPLAIVTQTHLTGMWQHAGCEVIDISNETEAWRQQDHSDPDPQAAGLKPENLAYVIYTSGSTGTPKGVMVEHRQLINYASAVSDRLGMTLPGASFGFVSTLAADLGNTVLFPSLISGGTLHVFTRAAITDAREFGAYCGKHRIDFLKITPSHFQALRGEAQSSVHPTIRCLIFGGEALTGDLIGSVRSQQPDCRIFNHYGPTECTVGVLAGDVSACSTARNACLGRPLNNARIYVLDGEAEPAPVGVAGELHIAGAGVARGYLNRPRLTAERFLPDPFSGDGGRMYRTGDLSRWTNDGTIDFLGRNDFQVKIRGFRIELGEIEARLSEYAGVREVALIALEDTSGEKRLVAYYTGKDNGAEQLRAHLSTKLPEYMVPAAYVHLDSLPLTPNGKLDRKALPAPDADSFTTRCYQAPQTETEQMLANLFAQLLNVERVGRHDNFFEFGGHSLLVVKLIERMRRAGLQADVRVIFERPTVAELANSITLQEDPIEIPPNAIPSGCPQIEPAMLPLVQLTKEEIQRIVGRVPGGASNIQDIYPLSPLQEGILFHHMMDSEGDPYLKAAWLRFDSRARMEAYIGALQAVIDRHDILRTGVEWEGLPEPVQVVWRKAPLAVQELDPEPGIQDLTTWMAERYDPRRFRIDLRQAPMMKAFTAFDQRTGSWLMTLLRHHLTGDHTTGEVMQEELEAHLIGKAGRLPAPPPFRNLVGQARLSARQNEHAEFFKKLLGDVEEPTAPFGLLNVYQDGTRIEQGRIPVDAGLERRIRERARALGVTAATMCHLAWAQVMSRVSGRSDVVFGTVLFGRMQSGAGSDRVMGLCMNTVPMRIQLAGMTLEAAVKQVHTQLGQLIRHEHCPLSLAQRCSRVAAPAPLFSALLNYRHSPRAEQVHSEDSQRVWEGIHVRAAEERTNYPITLSVTDQGPGLSLNAQVEVSVGARRVCELMHQALQSLADALEREPGTQAEHLDVLPDMERQRVLYEWNSTAADYPRDNCIHELFEQQVGRTPDAIAVVHGEIVLSYRELNRRANRLARYLISLGVKPGERVAICVERGAGMIVSLLAVLKAAGAYVPLDPAYPKERLKYMLEDSRPVALLTEPGLIDIFAEFTGLTAAVNITDEETWADQPETTPQSGGLVAEDLAYVIYTSGSTGTPKGVALSHRALNSYVQWAGRAYAYAGGAGAPVNTSLAFDATVTSIYLPLLAGQRVILIPEHNQIEALAELLTCGVGLTLVKLTPAHLQALPMVPGFDISRVKAARLIVGGEALPEAIVRDWALENPEVRIVNEYGPTEATVGCCTYEVDPRARIAGNVPIGKPIANAQMYILDPLGKPAPIMTTAEIYIGGEGLAQGYLNRPGPTAARFLPNPFQGYGTRMYRTGDLARWLEDGNLEYLGRNDFQVKIRGFRIELGEIEAALLEQPAVRQALVVAREDSLGEKRLVAYYTGTGTATSAERLRAHLSGKLPEYMVPVAYVRLESLPLTPNGKVDRKSLPEPDTDAFIVHGYEAPRTPTEEALASIFADLLKLERVGRNDNFFELGGHSLLATRAVTRMGHIFGVKLPLRTLFDAPTVADLSAVFENHPRYAAALERIGLLMQQAQHLMSTAAAQ